MNVVGFVPSAEAAETVVSWLGALSADEDTAEFLYRRGDAELATVEAIRGALGDSAATLTSIDDHDVVSAVVKRCRELKAELLTSTPFDIPDWPGQDSLKLIQAAPCRAVIGISGERSRENTKRPLVIASGGQHDVTLLELVANSTLPVTVAEIYDDIGEESESIGQRSLERLLHEANLHEATNIETKVIIDNHPIRGALRAVQGHDLVLVGLDQLNVVKPLHRAVKDAAIAVVKRAPRLRRRRLPDWMPRINPSDYVELVEDMRTGSKWGADFIVMLGMAAAIASLGLLQDSAAVVIGAMLIAPLMTPMIGLGLALAQASPRLAQSCGRTILLGILLTLAISLAIGVLLPTSETLSEEALDRGTPNILDLGIALFAGVAASYALARPGISAAIAGVAIATALVPPLCSVGISLAFLDWLNAFGALSLFVTNLLAIILASFATLSLMGVTLDRALPRHRRLARLSAITLASVLVLVAIPLGASLASRLSEGSIRPLGYPVKRTLARAIQERVDAEEDVELMFMARPSTSEGVVIYVSSDDDISRTLSDDLTELAREEMDDEELRVYVFAVRSAWKDEPPKPKTIPEPDKDPEKKTPEKKTPEPKKPAEPNNTEED
jgi:uncharacterized hydrophobic protein (TIGR00271 family)